MAQRTKSETSTYLLWGAFLLLAGYAIYTKSGFQGLNWRPLVQAQDSLNQ